MEANALELCLGEWRRNAAGVLFAVVAALHFPLIVLILLGQCPPVGALPKAAGITGYLAIAATALFRRVSYRTRLWVFFLAAYLAIGVASFALPYGPYAQLGLITTPIAVLVLCGSRAARAAIAGSLAFLVAGPFLRAVPGVARALEIQPAQAADPSAAAVWFRVAAMAVFLFVLMILLERFHQFLLRTLAERIAAQREIEREMTERQRLERQIADIGDAERRRLGHELHDGVCQQVAAALLRCQALERRLERGAKLSTADFKELSTLLTETIEEAHSVVRGLCPLEPDPEALAPALRTLTMRVREAAGVRCDYLGAGDLRLHDAATAQHLYRIAQEALSNAVRHANAGRITVELRLTNGELTLQVEDDGVGLPADVPMRGMGLHTMACRARILDGELTVAPAPGGGTRVTCRLPNVDASPASSRHSQDQRYISAR